MKFTATGNITTSGNPNVVGGLLAVLCDPEVIDNVSGVGVDELEMSMCRIGHMKVAESKELWQHDCLCPCERESISWRK